MSHKLFAIVLACCLLLAVAAVVVVRVVVFGQRSSLFSAAEGDWLVHEEWAPPIGASPVGRLQLLTADGEQGDRFAYASMERAGSNELAVVLITELSSLSLGSKEPIAARFLLYSLKTNSLTTSATVLLNHGQRYQYPSRGCPTLRDIQGPFKVGQRWLVVFDPWSGLAVGPNPAYAFSPGEPSSQPLVPADHKGGFLALAADTSGVYAVPYPEELVVGGRVGDPETPTGSKTVLGQLSVLDDKGNTLLSSPLQLNYSRPKGIWEMLYGFGIELKLTDQYVFILNRVPCMFAAEGGYKASAFPRLDVFDRRLKLLRSVELPATDLTGLFYSMDVDADSERVLIADSYSGRSFLYNFDLELIRTFYQPGNFGILASFVDFIMVDGKVYVLDGTGTLNVFDLGLSNEEHQ